MAERLDSVLGWLKSVDKEALWLKSVDKELERALEALIVAQAWYADDQGHIWERLDDLIIRAEQLREEVTGQIQLREDHGETPGGYTAQCAGCGTLSGNHALDCPMRESS